MITLFKAILLVALAVLAYLALFQLRGRWLQRALGIALGLLLAAFIVVPEMANAASQLVGVGRGADLVFYLSHILGAYFAIRIFQRQVRLEEQLTDLVRAISHLEARAPDGAETGGSTRLRIFSTHAAGDQANGIKEIQRQARSA